MSNDILKTAAAFGAKLSMQGTNFVLRHNGNRIILTESLANSLLSALVRDTQAEGARYDDHGPMKYGLNEWVTDFVRNELMDAIVPDALIRSDLISAYPLPEPVQTGHMDEVFEAAARFGNSDDMWSAADEDAAWAVMMDRGSY